MNQQEKQTNKQRQNIRLGLILASTAFVFALGFVLKVAILGKS